MSSQLLYDLTLPEWARRLAERGEPAYRARQIFHNLYQRGISDPERMTDLPQRLRQLLAKEFTALTLVPVQRQEAADGTSKWLSKLQDGQLLETVLIPARSRRTVCVSTQVGCAYACAFCASGMNGLRRNLTTGEIVQQVLLGSDPSKRGQTPSPFRVTNVVFMGMGEPLANYDNLLKAIRILNAPEGLHLGARKITISTVGLVPMIERLAKEGLQIELSISLHAPNDELRGRLMPVNRKYPLAQLIPAVKAYMKATKRLVTFEYILIDQVNDGLDQAKELAKLLQGMLCKVNLIPCHPVPGLKGTVPEGDSPFARPPLPRMLAFERCLLARKIPCTLRRSRGLDIDGACGQLRLHHEERIVVK